MVLVDEQLARDRLSIFAGWGAAVLGPDVQETGRVRTVPVRTVPFYDFHLARIVSQQKMVQRVPTASHSHHHVTSFQQLKQNKGFKLVGHVVYSRSREY